MVLSMACRCLEYVSKKYKEDQDGILSARFQRMIPKDNPLDRLDGTSLIIVMRD